MIRLHHIPGSRSMRVLWLLEELGLDADLRVWSLTDGSLRSPEFRAMSPAGRVPALEVDGRTIFECTSKEEVFDLLQGGQGVFGIGIGGAMRELAGSISEFPSEQVDDGAAAAAVVEDELAARRRARATRRTG